MANRKEAGVKAGFAFLERYRRGGSFGERSGAFQVPLRPGVDAVVIVSEGCTEVPWEHVSARVYYRKANTKKWKCRVPTWAEMCQIKDLFWDAEEWVVQFHPAASEYVNFHPMVLHLWKPSAAEMPTPPASAVGPKTVERREA